MTVNFVNFSQLRVVGAASVPRLDPPASGTSAEVRVIQPSTILNLKSTPVDQPVYEMSSVGSPTAAGRSRAWLTAPDDAISQLMARNESGASRSLADQWRGLGGALLTRIGTTQGDYQQAVVDYEAQLANAVHDPQKQETVWNTSMGVTETSAVQALGEMQNAEVSVDLMIQTHSGQTVSVKILLNSRSPSVTKGLHAEIQTSGNLSDAERTAVAKLADGLDKALEGLGQQDALKIDMSGLLGYDKSVLSKLDLTIGTATRSGDLGLESFELHASADQQTIKAKGWSSEMSLTVDSASSLGVASQEQRQRAIKSYLDQFDAAARRSHANADLVAQFKDAFVQLHEATANGAAQPEAPSLTAPLHSLVQPLLSGLSDFEASFGGDFADGDVGRPTTEAGHMEYRISHKTSISQGHATGAASITQTQSENLSADYKQSRGGATLDVSRGNYDSYHVQDDSVSSTLIEAAQNLLVSAGQERMQNQFHRYQKFDNHRVVAATDSPLSQHSMRNLIRV